MSDNIINEMRQDALEKARKRLRTIGWNSGQMESFVDLTFLWPRIILRLDPTKEFLHIPYMPQSTLTSKNQTTIPKAVIEALNLRPSDQLVYDIEEDGRILLSAKTGTFASVAASLPRKPKANPARSVEEMKSAVKDMARKRMSRTKP